MSDPSLPPAPACPTGTVTLVFTDIEGSSDLWQQYAAAFQPVLEAHNRLMREAADRWNGFEVKTEGDAFMLAFARASDAVQFAVEAQLALLRTDWQSLLPGLIEVRVRMGMHTGEPLLIRHPDGAPDYFGPVVNRAARVAAAGYGGQVLISEPARVLAAAADSPQVTFLDLGKYRLKGVGDEQIWQVCHPDLPREFGQLRTMDVARHNLPAPATPFIARDRELESARRLLASARLLTLTGPGGTGKTRLALQVAEVVSDEFSDGVCFVALAPVSSADLVPSTIAQALVVREVGGRPLIEAVKEHLKDKHLLLVLDNFEQVVSAAPLVADILAHCTRLKVLATSRAALHLYGEQEYPVPPLELPDPKRLPSIERLSQYSAVALFIDRALAAKPDFTVTNENAPAVAEICARLDGLPLAIELAAARIKLLPPQAMLPRLSSRLKLLSGGARDLPARQQTLRGMIAWSHDLLDDSEKTLFRRLSVFVNGAALDAAEAVCDPEGELPIDVLDGIASLADQSLLRQNDTAAEPRVTMLETIREFGLECLSAAGESEDLRRRHADHFLALAEAAEPQLLSPEQEACMGRLDAEHDNLRAALTWYLERDPTPAARLAGSLWVYWFFRGHLGEGWERLNAALLRADAIESPAALARVLTGAGVYAYFRGDLERTVSLCAQSLEAARRADLPWHTALSLILLGALAFYQGHFAEAEPLCEESVSLARASGDPWLTALSLTNAALLALHRGDVARATEMCRESIPLARQAGEKWCVGHSLYNLGLVLLAQGNHAAAAQPLREGLAHCCELKYHLGIGLALDGLAGVAAMQGESRRAVRLLGAGAALRETLGAAMPPAFRTTYDQIMGAARLPMDPPAFEQAWAEGQALTLEEAVAFAMEEDPGASPRGPAEARGS